MEDEQDLCRVCRSGDEEGPLKYPCLCSGSMKFVHEACLTEWLSVSKKDKCELCNAPLTYTRVFSPNMPENLPAHLILRHLCETVAYGITFLARAVLVAFAWLAVLPHNTVWVFRFFLWSAEGLGSAIRLILKNPAGHADSWQMSAATSIVDVASNGTLQAKQQALDDVVELATNWTRIQSDDAISMTMKALGVKSYIKSLPACPAPWTVVKYGIRELVTALGNETTVNPIGNLTVIHQLRYLSEPKVEETWRRVLEVVVKDVFTGQIITSTVIVLFICCFLLREWIIMNAPFLDARQQEPAAAARRFVRVPVAADGRQNPQDAPVFAFANPLNDVVQVAAFEQAVGTEILDSSPSYQASPAESLDTSIQPSSTSLAVTHDGAHEDQEDAALQVEQVESERDYQDPDDGFTLRRRSRQAENSKAALRKMEERIRRDERAERRATLRSSDTEMLANHAAEGSSSASPGNHKGKGRALEEDNQSGATPSEPIPPGLGSSSNQGVDVERNQSLQPASHITSPVTPNAPPFLPLPPPPLNIPPAAGEILPAPPVPEVGEGANPEEEVFPEDGLEDFQGVLEAVGMNGPLYVLVQNMGLMHLMIALCLAGAVWLPLCIGKSLAAGNAVRLVTLPLKAIRSISDPVFDALFTVLTQLPSLAYSYCANRLSGLISLLPAAIQQGCEKLFANSTSALVADEYGRGQGTSATTRVAMSILPGMARKILPRLPHSSTPFNVMAKEGFRGLAYHWDRMADNSDDVLHRVLCVALGYMAFAVLGGCYIRSTRNAYSHNVSKVIRDAVKQQLQLVKVLMFLFIEIIVFPSLCGIVLNLATLPIFQSASIASRYALFHRAPLSALFLVWLTGTAFMFSFSVAIDGIRDSVRSGVLWFIRDPTSAEFHPIREILERSSTTQARKIAISGVLYATVIFATFGINILFLRYACRGVLPLRWAYNRQFSFPLDLIIFRFVIPFTLRTFSPKDKLRAAVLSCAKRTAKELRLSSFMFGHRDPLEEGSQIRRTWKALLTLRKALVDEQEAGVDDSSNSWVSSHREVVFRPDGGFARVPAIDQVKVAPGRRMIVPVTELGYPKDAAGAAIIGSQLIEMATTRRGDKYEVVYIPPNFTTRICLFVYLMWFAISLTSISFITIPLLTGRYLFTFLTTGMVHDLYSFATGLYVLVFAGLAVSSIPQAANYSPPSPLANWSMTVHFAGITFGAGVLLPLMSYLAVSAYILLPLFPAVVAVTGIRSNDNIPTFHLLQSWATGLMIVSALYHFVQMGLIKAPAYQVTIRESQEAWAEGRRTAAMRKLNKELVYPLISRLFLILAIPAASAYLFCSSRKVLSDVDATVMTFKMAYTVSGVLGVCFGLSQKFKSSLAKWEGRLREREYMVERRLRNYEETLPAQTAAEITSAEVGA